MEQTEATFNGIPKTLDSILERMEKLEGMISDIHIIHKSRLAMHLHPHRHRHHTWRVELHGG